MSRSSIEKRILWKKRLGKFQNSNLNGRSVLPARTGFRCLLLSVEKKAREGKSERHQIAQPE